LGAGGGGAQGGSSGTVDPGAGGGTVNPGAGGAGGTSSSGAGGAGPPAAGTAPMKFCSSLLRNGVPINFELAVGTVRMKASAVNCSTALNQACMRVPVGEQTITLYEGTKVWATKTATIFATGEYYAFTSEKDDKVSYDFVNFNVGPEATCSNKPFPP
jgi:hypothetical protein